MDTSTLTPAQRQERMNVRNFLLTASREQLLAELMMAREKPVYAFKAACIVELIHEFDRENPNHETPTRQLLNSVADVLKHICKGKDFSRRHAWEGFQAMNLGELDELTGKLQNLSDNALLVELLTDPDYKAMP
jgi:hypothetical protein